METLEEIRAEVARIYRNYLPARLAGMSPAEQEAMFEAIAETVLDEADQLSLFDDLPETSGGRPHSRRPPRRQRRRGRPQSGDGPVQLSLDFDQPTPVEVVDPGGTPLPTRPAKSYPVEQPAAAADFVPQADPTVPSGLRARAEANLAALQTLKVLEAERRPATRTSRRCWLAGHRGVRCRRSSRTTLAGRACGPGCVTC